MVALLGIDIGTTNTKVYVYNEVGRLLANKSFQTPFYHEDTGGIYNSEEIFNRLLNTIAGFDKNIKKDIIALSVSSFAETIIGICTKGTPITNGIAWFDSRTKELFKISQKQINKENIYQITGLLPHYIYSFYKLLWYKENKKDIYNKVKIWTSMSGYILYSFSGKLSFDYSLASRTMLFDQHKRCWCEKIACLAEIPIKKLAQVVPSGRVLGKIKKDIANIIGLSPDVLIVTGGHDHLCAALSAGVYQNGNVLISTGTTESLTMSLNDIPKINILSLKRPFTWGHHSAFPYFYAMNGIYGGGCSIDWILNILKENYHIFDTLLVPKNNIPIFFPYLRGSDYEEARGAFLNLESNMGKDEILQGLIAGLCFEYRSVWEEMENTLDLSIDRVINVGGGSKNHYWMKMKSTILNQDIIVPKDKEGSSKGAALLAGIGSGVYLDVHKAFKNTFKCDRVYKPLAELKDKLDNLYYLYYEIMEDLKIINTKIKATSFNL